MKKSSRVKVILELTVVIYNVYFEFTSLVYIAQTGS